MARIIDSNEKNMIGEKLKRAPQRKEPEPAAAF